MHNKTTDKREISLPIGITNDDARDSVLDFYTRSRSSYASTEDAQTPESSKLRRSIFRALAYEDQPDPYLESAKPIPIPSKEAEATTSTAPVPPKRPPRPRNTSLSWMYNSSGNPWVDISLNGTSPVERIDFGGSQRRSKSASPSSYFCGETAGTTQIGDSERNSMEKSFITPPPVGFWHRSLKRERLQVFGRWALMTLLLSAFIVGVLALYWAVVVDVDKNLSTLNVYVVNFETLPDAIVGPVVTQVTQGIVLENREPHLGFMTVPPAAFQGDHLAVREAVWDNKAWAAIVVNSNATQLLRQALGFANSSYDPTGAIQVIYNEAREQDLYFDHVYPLMETVQTKILEEFGRRWTSEIMSNAAVTKANMGKVPQAVNPGIGFSTYNLRPLLPHTAIPAVSIGLIYLIIISFFSFSFYLPIHTRLIKGQGHPPVKFWQFILWRWIATIVAYLILSLAYSLVSVAFQFPFGNSPGSHFVTELTPSKFYDATFLVYWMINFCGMIALGLACENMAMFLGMPWTALWLIFWVITNVATAFYAIQLESSFYRWGYAWPLHNIVEASRTTLFDLHSNLAVNFGVLIAWSVVNTILFPFACLFLKWKTAKALEKQLQEGGH